MCLERRIDQCAVDTALTQRGPQAERTIAPFDAGRNVGFRESLIALQPGLGQVLEFRIDIAAGVAPVAQLACELGRRVFASGQQPKRGLVQISGVAATGQTRRPP